MFKLRQVWSEHKADTLAVLLLTIFFIGVFVVVSYLHVESLEQPTPLVPPHRPSSPRSWLF